MTFRRVATTLRRFQHRAQRIEGCLYCKACGDYTYQPGYGCLACGFVEPGV